MRATTRGRLLAAAVVPALLLATGCLYDDEGGGPGALGRPTDGGLTVEQLRAARVTDADLGPDLEVAEQASEHVQKQVGDGCEPVMNLLEGGTSTPALRAELVYTVSDTRAPAGTVPVVGMMASLAPGEAARLMKEGTAALARCSSFTGTTTDGTTARYTATRTQMSSYGDESIALRLDTSVNGGDIITGYVIVRTGDVLSGYVALSGDDRVDFPDAKLIKAQVDKLRAALSKR